MTPFYFLTLLFLHAAYCSFGRVSAMETVVMPTFMKEHKVNQVVYQKRYINATEVKMDCNISATKPSYGLNIFFQFNGQAIKADDKKYSVETVEGSNYLRMIIKRPEATDIGEYFCSTSIAPKSNLNITINLQSPPIVGKDDTSLRQKPGTKNFSLICEYDANPKPSAVTWHIKMGDDGKLQPWTRRSGITVENQIDPKTKKTLGIKNVLMFDEIQYEDRGTYFCQVENELGVDTMGWYLRVVNPKAPLWPLIGIIIEVLIVVVIIIVYEWNARKKRRAKQQAEAEATAALNTASDEPNRRCDEGASSQTRQRPARV